MKSSNEALLFFGELMQLHVRFLSSTHRRTMLKKTVSLSLKSQSATRRKSRILCISPSRYRLVDVQVLERHRLEKKNGETVNIVRALILKIESWNFILSIIIWHDLLVN